jgi:hypothetical protein
MMSWEKGSEKRETHPPGREGGAKRRVGISISVSRFSRFKE